MYKALSAGAIGVSAGSLENALRLAAAHGFAGLEFGAGEVANLIDAHGTGYVRDLFAASGVLPAGFGLPTEWRGEDEKFQQSLRELPRLARAAAAIGGNRTATWIMPCSNDRIWNENLAFHIARFTPIAHILHEEGIRLGLEFIGPKTLRESQRYPFIHTMEQMLEMGQQIGPNVGLLLDCWHWYTSHGSLADLEALTNDQVVYVHVNDAPAGVAINDNVDNVRGLPGATGIIDIAGFLAALRHLEYDGPIIAEPFEKSLAALPSDEARLETVSQALDRILALP